MRMFIAPGGSSSDPGSEEGSEKLVGTTSNRAYINKINLPYSNYNYNFNFKILLLGFLILGFIILGFEDFHCLQF